MQSPESIPLVTTPELDRLALALRDMPQVGPEQSSWEAISARLDSAPVASARARPVARRWVGLAAAASIAAASAWLGFGQHDRAASQAAEKLAVVDNTNSQSDATPSTQQRLMARSGSLERWLIDSGSAQWPQDFGSASASVEIENLIAHVDQRLTRSSSAAERDQLWQRRVTLLEQLVTLQGEPMVLSLAASDRSQLL